MTNFTAILVGCVEYLSLRSWKNSIAFVPHCRLSGGLTVVHACFIDTMDTTRREIIATRSSRFRAKNKF